MSRDKIEEKINNILDTIRPFLINEGGNIELIKYDNNIVYIKMQGACADCLSLDYTIKDVIETALKDEIPEIKEVINVP